MWYLCQSKSTSIDLLTSPKLNREFYKNNKIKSAGNEKNNLPLSHLQAKDAQSLNTFVKCEKGCKNLAGLLICHNLCKNCLVYEKKSLFLIMKAMSQHYREFGKQKGRYQS